MTQTRKREERTKGSERVQNSKEERKGKQISKSLERDFFLEKLREEERKNFCHIEPCVLFAPRDCLLH